MRAAAGGRGAAAKDARRRPVASTGSLVFTIANAQQSQHQAAAPAPAPRAPSGGGGVSSGGRRGARHDEPAGTGAARGPGPGGRSAPARGRHAPAGAARARRRGPARRAGGPCGRPGLGPAGGRGRARRRHRARERARRRRGAVSRRGHGRDQGQLPGRPQPLAAGRTRDRPGRACSPSAASRPTGSSCSTAPSASWRAPGSPSAAREGRSCASASTTTTTASPSTSGEIGSCFARLVSTTCTALVSFGVVKDHDLAGVSAGLKNLYGVIHNPNKYHDHNCDPYVADVANHPFVRRQAAPRRARRRRRRSATAARRIGRTRPGRSAWWRPRPIRSRRTRGRGRSSTPSARGGACRPLAEAKRPPRFLATAARYGLGVGDPAAIVEVRA